MFVTWHCESWSVQVSCVQTYISEWRDMGELETKYVTLSVSRGKGKAIPVEACTSP